MRARLFYIGLLLLAGCSSPHGGIRIPGVPEQRAPNVYGGDGRTYETAFKLRRVTDRDVVYLENGWLYDKYRMEQRPEPSYEEFCRAISRRTEKVGGRLYHVVTFGSSGGGTGLLYFDVTGIIHE